MSAARTAAAARSGGDGGVSSSAATAVRQPPERTASHEHHAQAMRGPAPGMGGAPGDVPRPGGSNQTALSRGSAAAPPALRAAPTGLYPKLTIGDVNDPLERDADRAAAQVLRMSEPAAAASPAPAPSPVGVQRKCAACEQDDEPLQRKETGAAPQAATAPAAVHAALAGPGTSLDASSRAYFEPRFRQDFSSVTIHQDAAAAASARAVGALAYTVGDHIVLGEGQSVGNRPLLAHELAHVVQQSGGRAVLRRFTPCRHLLDADEGVSVPEFRVRDAIADQAKSLGTVEREFHLPGASAAPLRTESDKRRGGDVIDPQVIDPDGFGRADVAVLTGSTLDIIEVKKASWGADGVTFGAAQLANYIITGTAELEAIQRLWRVARKHPNDSITAIRAMPTSRLTPTTPQNLGGANVSLAWCTDGLMSFKAIKNRDQDVFVCGVNDQGRIDAFIDRLMDPAQAEVERFLSREIEARAMKALDGLSLRQILTRFMNIPQIKSLLPAGIELLGDGPLMDVLAQQLKPLEADIRLAAQTFLRRVVAEIRSTLQAEIRTMLQDTMAALCAATAELTRKQIIEAFKKRMQQAALGMIPAVAMKVASAMLQEAAEAALVALAMAVGIVAAAILLWEAVAAVAAIEGIGAILISIGAFIARLGPVLAGAFTAAESWGASLLPDLESLIPSFAR